eukprot:6489618-Amphidinium_carterae.2
MSLQRTDRLKTNYPEKRPDSSGNMHVISAWFTWRGQFVSSFTGKRGHPTLAATRAYMFAHNGVKAL